MRAYLAVAAVAMMASMVKAGQIYTPYNLIASHQILAPQYYAQPQHQPQPRIILATDAHNQDLAHPAVVENAIAESRLPGELLNPFYKNPAIASALAKESWFLKKEFPVHNREAEKIDRQKIFQLVGNIESTR
ncbi:unnamed protein product [Brassicogethes aeneus]|uniref:Uncharacterized protein n=1 Tax=Brassicogethes aeneus TaxID=1431903 RepID=A0A9P0B9F3_BRAAE|nr:unnamed protein product [Brassicogethes aeneus]